MILRMAAPEEEVRRDFVLTFEGPAVATGRMPVRDLAPSLLALGDLFQEANTAVDPMAPPVSLEVRAFDRGSFAAALHVASVDVSGLLSSPAFQQVALLIGLIADSSKGLFALIRWIRGRTGIQRTEIEPGVTRLEIEGDVFVANTMTVNLGDRPSVRRLARDVVRPLLEEGIERMEIQRPYDEPLELEAEEVQVFEAAVDEEDPAADQVLEGVLVSVISPAFNPKYKWRLQFGEQTIMATVADERFIERIQRHEVAFLEGDVLQVRLRIRQWPPESGRSMEWIVEEVQDLRHLGVRPTTLPFSDEKEEA